MLRRAGLIGDIHCELESLQRVIEHFRAWEVDSVLAVGDIADGPGDLTATCALLEQNGVLAVAGNHDRWLLAGEMRELPDATPCDALTPQARAYLTGLPKTRVLDSPRGSVLLCHGLGEDDMASVRPDDEGLALHDNHVLCRLIQGGAHRFVINGHTHRPMLRTIDGLTILNAGTLHPKHRPVCSIADFDAGKVHLFDLSPAGVVTAEQWSFERGSRPVQSISG